eukprot:3864685-Rhodomonas_salina.1
MFLEGACWDLDNGTRPRDACQTSVSAWLDISVSVSDISVSVLHIVSTSGFRGQGYGVRGEGLGLRDVLESACWDLDNGVRAESECQRARNECQRVRD